VAALEAPGHPALLKDAGEIAGVGSWACHYRRPEGALGRDRILIEFSIPTRPGSSAHDRPPGWPCVIGTTASQQPQREIERLARESRSCSRPI